MARGPDPTNSTAVVDRKPPWVFAGLLLIAIVVLLAMPLLTRGASRRSDDDSAPATTIAPATTSIGTPQTLAPSSSTEASDPRQESHDGASSAPEFLPFDEDVVASLPPGGVDGWLFSRDGRAQLTRTDLMTGDQVRIDLSEDRPTEFFPFPLPLVAVGETLVWAGGDRIVLIDVETLESTVIDHNQGFAGIVTYDEHTVWLSSLSSLFSLDLATFVVSDLLGADALERGGIRAGALAGVLRYTIPSRGSWELRNGQNTRIQNVVVAGTIGGTLEIECPASPNECVMLIQDMATGIKTVIDVPPQSSGVSLSPNLDAVATATEIVRTDRTKFALDPDSGRWLWSSDGRFVSLGDLTVIDVLGDTPRFQIPGRSLGFREAALVVLRATD